MLQHSPLHMSQRTFLFPWQTLQETAVFFCRAHTNQSARLRHLHTALRMAVDKAVRSLSRSHTRHLQPVTMNLPGQQLQKLLIMHAGAVAASIPASCLTLFSVTTTLAMPMLTELTSMVAAPRPTIVVPDASKARPNAALAAMLPTQRRTAVEAMLLVGCAAPAHSVLGLLMH